MQNFFVTFMSKTWSYRRTETTPESWTQKRKMEGSTSVSILNSINFNTTVKYSCHARARICQLDNLCKKHRLGTKIFGRSSRVRFRTTMSMSRTYATPVYPGVVMQIIYIHSHGDAHRAEAVYPRYLAYKNAVERVTHNISFRAATPL